MLHLSSVARTLALALAFAGGAAIAMPATPAAAKSKAAKKKSKAKHAKRAKVEKAAKSSKKVNALAVAGWYKRGDSYDDIVARVEEAGWSPSAKDVAILKKKKVPASLISQLKGEPEPTLASTVSAPPAAAAAPAPAKKVDLTKPAKVSDIDFDDVAPPQGTPGWVDAKQREEKAQAAQRATDTAKPAATAAPATGAQPMRRVITVSDG
jgi:hypothetical protein